ncbi:MAG: hypothetical protein QNJ97_27955 [Myxococcota bacterium]|nr:hypothetical protein [Myxococcota bacterium]
MDKAKHAEKTKNALYSPGRDSAVAVESARVFTWEEPMPWFATAKRKLAATVRPHMQLSYSPRGDYQLAYNQALDPGLERMRWTYRIIALDSNEEEMFDFLVDTRELTVYRETKAWAYQIHTGDEVNLKRHFDKIASFGRVLSGNAWFKDKE